METQIILSDVICGNFHSALSFVRLTLAAVLFMRGVIKACVLLNGMEIERHTAS